MVAWSGAAAARVEPAPRRRSPPRPRPATPVRRQRQERAGILGGVVWIVALAALLAGVVALNVAVLRLNMRLDELSRQRTELRAANAALSSQLSSAAAGPQVEALARSRLGLVEAPPEQTYYVDLAP